MFFASFFQADWGILGRFVLLELGIKLPPVQICRSNCMHKRIQGQRKASNYYAISKSKTWRIPDQGNLRAGLREISTSFSTVMQYQCSWSHKTSERYQLNSGNSFPQIHQNLQTHLTQDGIWHQWHWSPFCWAHVQTPEDFYQCYGLIPSRSLQRKDTSIPGLSLSNQ